MKTIKNAVFLKSESEIDGYKGYGVPEIVLLGRSNVGKSSFINRMSNNKKLAKTSNTPRDCGDLVRFWRSGYPAG